jgi:hypothetical protein
VDAFSTKQLYLPDTAVLITRFMTEAEVGEIVDFMPVEGRVATARHRLVRMVRCVRGEMTFALDIAPRFNYGRESSQTHLTDDGVVFEGADTAITICLIREPDEERSARVRVDERGDVHAEITLVAGQMRGLVLQTGAAGPVRQVQVAEAERWWPLRRPVFRSRSVAYATGTTATPGSGTLPFLSTPCSAWVSPKKRRLSAAGCAIESPSRRTRTAAAR